MQEPASVSWYAPGWSVTAAWAAPGRAMASAIVANVAVRIRRMDGANELAR